MQPRRQFLALIAALGCQPRPPPVALRWRQAAAGLQYASAQISGDGGHQPALAHLLRLDLQVVRLQVVLAPEVGAPLADAAAFRRHAGGLAAVNAGFFDPAFRPLGLLVSGGAELSPLRKVDHGVFWVAGGRAHVDHARQWLRAPNLEFAVECGPRLLVSGTAPHFRQSDTARRVALGLDAQRRTVLAVSDGAVTLHDFAAWLARPEVAGGPGLVDALNLDGGPSAMLDVAAGNLVAEVRSPVQVPVGLVIAAR